MVFSFCLSKFKGFPGVSRYQKVVTRKLQKRKYPGSDINQLTARLTPSTPGSAEVREMENLYVVRHIVKNILLYHAHWITNMRGCVTHNDLWSISSRSFSHDFAIKQLKYVQSWCVQSTACTDLDGYFPYLAQMITSMRGCVNRSKVKVTWAIQILAVEAREYPSKSHILNFWFVVVLSYLYIQFGKFHIVFSSVW